MSEKTFERGLIASPNLNPADVPDPQSELENLETFCLTIDGYEGGRFSIEDLLEKAKRVERVGLENASLDELRIAAFIRQRELRWTTHGDELADAPLIAKIRRLVAEIRQRVVDR